MGQQSVHRRLAAILAADMVDFSRQMGSNEAGTLIRLQTHRKEIWDPCIAKFEGRVVKQMGDGLLVEFPSVVNAVQCALAVQKSTQAWNADRHDHHKIVYRIGVNLGDVILDGDDIFGDGVNIAARLETLAEPGSICVSGSVYNNVRQVIDGEFDYIGEQALKNIVAPVPVWQWRTSGNALAETIDIDTGDRAAPDEPSKILASLHVLGEFRITLADGRDAILRGRKTQALFAYLALAANRRVTREALATLLWSRGSDEQARGSLRQSLKEIRTCLGPAAEHLLIADRNDILIDRRRIWIDAVELEHCSMASNIGGKPAVGALYAGDLLANLTIRGEETFDDWLQIERTRLRDLAIMAWTDALNRATASRASAQIKATAKGMLSIERTNEQAYRALMRLAADSGDPATAFRHYESCRDALLRELDIEPSEATEQLREAIANGEYFARPEDLHEGPQGIGSASADEIQKSKRPSIAVLPFRGIGDDERYQYLREGLADDLITSLSKFREVFVIARASSFVFNQPHADSRQIARQLGVRYVLEGSLRIAGEGLRINAQLVDGPSGAQIWADRYDVPTAQTLDVLDELVIRIIGTILPVVELTQTEISRRKSPQNMAAYDYYLRGKYLVHNVQSFDDAQKAMELLEKSISIDPDLTIAYGHLVRICNTDFLMTRAGGDVERYRSRAYQLAETALALDPADPHAHISVGWCHLWRGNFERAKLHFDRALSLNPYDADRITDIATALMYLGEVDRAIEIVKRAMAFNPNHPESYLADLAEFYFMKCQYEDTIALFETVSDRPPSRVAWRAAAHAYLGQIEEANREVENFCRQMRTIWAGRADAGAAEHVAWLLSHCPFKSRKDSEHLVTGLRKAGLPV